MTMKIPPQTTDELQASLATVSKIKSELVGIPEHQAQANPIARMLDAIVEKGVTPENVTALKEITALYQTMEKIGAEKAFAAAFNALQAELPGVVANKAVPDKFGHVKYKFAPYEEIMEAVRPSLQRHGFSITFSTDFRDGRIFQTCTLIHVGGHSRQNTFMVRVGNGPPGASEAQADGAASTYAKRFALCNALNITIETDMDGREDEKNDGAPITFEQAETLREMVRETGSDEVRFLKYAGVSKYEDIGSARYSGLFAELQKRRK